LKLFKTCLSKYAEKGMIIADFYLGSFSAAVACYQMGLDWVGSEKDNTHFLEGSTRYRKDTNQILMEFDQ
jgi:DNA modification methylase